MKKIIPRNQYVLIKPAPVTDKVSEHGIISPDTVEEERKAVGTVFAVSEEIVGLKKGDEVVYGVYSGETLEVDEGGKKVEYKLVHNDDIIAVLK